MKRVRERGEEIRRFLLNNVQANPRNVSKLAIDKFGITRQAVNAHLSRLVDEGSLTQSGNTQARTYALAPLVEWHTTYRIGTIVEDVAWRKDIDYVLGKLPDNVSSIWHYGFTEMFNNALDHSAGATIYVEITKTAISTSMLIKDDGVGIFRKIQKAMNLLDERHAVFELSKGKLTTDPARHSGEGIFFTSRMFDRFTIFSGGVYFTHHFGKAEDWVLEEHETVQGTSIFLDLGNHPARTMRKVFDQYSSGEDYGFTKTVVPVDLARYGNDQLISRSQAKRVMARVELFKTVILDFSNVPTIGQAFADEVFRVFALEHPQVTIMPIHANSEVKRMIARATTVESSPSPSPGPPVENEDETAD